MRKTHTLKQFKYKDKTYKFKEPLKIIIDNYLASDYKTECAELSIPSINDGYSILGTIDKPEKAIREHLTYIFENYLMKKDTELDEYEQAFKKSVIKLIDEKKSK